MLLRAQKTTLTLAILGTALSGTPAFGQDPDIKRTIEGIVEAINSGDVAGFVSFYSDDAIRMPPGEQPVAGAEAIQIAMTEFAAETEMNLRIPAIGTVMDGDLAVAWVYPYTFLTRAKSGGQPLVEQGKWVVILQRRSGEWKVISDMWNRIEEEGS